MDCDKILDKLIMPSIITAIKGVLSLGMYNNTMNIHNINIFREYRTCSFSIKNK